MKKEIKAAIKILEAKILKRRIPIITTFAITHRCISHCLYCNFWRSNTPEMTTEEILFLLRQLKIVGCQRIAFTGGEPLLREDIGKIINYAKKLGFFVSLNSNGFFVPEKIEEIKDVDMLHLSFDGPKKIHDKLKREGFYDKLMRAIKIAKKYGIKVTATTVITKYNVNAIDFILRKARKLGFFAYFQPVGEYPHASENVKELFPPIQSYRKAIRKLIRAKLNGEYVGNSLPTLLYLYDFPIHKKKLKCFAGDLHIRIEANGIITPCYETKCEKILNCRNNFNSAYNLLKKIDCVGCWCHAEIEYNYLFSLNLHSLLNAFWTLNKIV
jgi:MoaA/NifB/PqqE/SkfB family radical SAM enzyme